MYKTEAEAEAFQKYLKASIELDKTIDELHSYGPEYKDAQHLWLSAEYETLKAFNNRCQTQTHNNEKNDNKESNNE